MIASPARFDRGVLRWLISITLMVLAMVVIGGVTRLTGSGLSITDWSPIMGAIPPLNETQWQETFAKYQATPQYLKVNEGMPLSEFKFIFFWEYFHRLVGRSIGVVVLIPLFIFWRKKKIDGKLIRRVLIGFALGGLQGILGWFMVKSGLIDVPSVSHYRLASHLLLAFIILSYFTWVIGEYRAPHQTWVKTPNTSPTLKRNFRGLKLLIVVQIIYGAFVAGLKAGWAFNTFPKMAGEWIPGNLWVMDPLLKNALENPATVQWIHRWLGMGVVLFTTLFYLQIKHSPGLTHSKRWATGLNHMIYLQLVMGIFTLIMQVPLILGVAHQLGAAIVVILLTGLSSSLKRET